MERNCWLVLVLSLFGCASGYYLPGKHLPGLRCRLDQVTTDIAFDIVWRASALVKLGVFHDRLNQFDYCLSTTSYVNLVANLPGTYPREFFVGQTLQGRLCAHTNRHPPNRLDCSFTSAATLQLHFDLERGLQRK